MFIESAQLAYSSFLSAHTLEFMYVVESKFGYLIDIFIFFNRKQIYKQNDNLLTYFNFLLRNDFFPLGGLISTFTFVMAVRPRFA